MNIEAKAGPGDGSGGSDLRYLRNSRAISGRLDDELVMMDIEQGKYFALNPVATRIWELLEKPLTVGELCLQLRQEYDVEEEQCLAETMACIDDMARFGLVKEKNT